MTPVFIVVIGFVLSGVLAYSAGYTRGKRQNPVLQKDVNGKQDRYTAFIVVGIIFVIIGIAFSVSLDIWDKQNGTRLILGILTVLILAGALGGLIGNYYRKQKIGSDGRSFDLLVSVLLGIGASLLVPVLLHILTSSLLSDIGVKPEKAFILAGFCLAAAISAEAFIERILRNFNQMGESKPSGTVAAQRPAQRPGNEIEHTVQ